MKAKNDCLSIEDSGEDDGVHGSFRFLFLRRRQSKASRVKANETKRWRMSHPRLTSCHLQGRFAFLCSFWLFLSVLFLSTRQKDHLRRRCSLSFSQFLTLISGPLLLSLMMMTISLTDVQSFVGRSLSFRCRVFLNCERGQLKKDRRFSGEVHERSNDLHDHSYDTDALSLVNWSWDLCVYIFSVLLMQQHKFPRIKSFSYLSFPDITIVR
jgi:hypothetical protein